MPAIIVKMDIEFTAGRVNPLPQLYMQINTCKDELKFKLNIFEYPLND